MRRSPKVSTPILICAAVLMLSAPSAFACGCGEKGPASESYRSAAAVFVAEVAEVYEPPPKTSERRNPDGSVTVSVSPGGPWAVTLAVQRAFKGVEEKRFKYEYFPGDGCSYHFKKGESYLIYGYLEEKKLTTNKCTRTRGLSSAAEDLKYLESLLENEPLGIIYGDAYREIIDDKGEKALQVPFEELTVVAESDGGRRYEVRSERHGEYQIAVVPGVYRLWVERNGKRASEIKKVIATSGAAQREIIAVKFE